MYQHRIRSITSLLFLATKKATSNHLQVRTKVRKYDKSQAEIIPHNQQYSQEPRRRQSYNLNKVVQRTDTASGVSARTMNRIRNEHDVNNWKYEGEDRVRNLIMN